jgi:hypothetical protein
MNKEMSSLERLEKSLEGVNIEEFVGLLEKTISTTTSGSYAEREHLDNRITDITNRKTPLLDRIRRIKANGVTHEWDMITALGSTDTAVAECGTPPANEATITRYSAAVKTFATRVEICDKAQWGSADYFNLSETHLSMGMRKIVQDVEKKCFYGNSDVNPAEFDGIYEIVDDNASGNIIDGAGVAITEAKINSAIQVVLDNGGVADSIFMAADDLRDWADLWASKVTYMDPTGGMTTGYNVARYMSFAGPLDIVMDTFITDATSPNTYGDAFVLTLEDIALAETEPMYRLPSYRGLTLAETQAVVWNCVLEVKIPQFQAIVKNVQ